MLEETAERIREWEVRNQVLSVLVSVCSGGVVSVCGTRARRTPPLFTHSCFLLPPVHINSQQGLVDKGASSDDDHQLQFV